MWKNITGPLAPSRYRKRMLLEQVRPIYLFIQEILFKHPLCNMQSARGWV